MKLKKTLSLCIITLIITLLSIISYALDNNTNVAIIGETNYTTLEDAIKAIETTGTIKIINDIVLEESLTIPANKNITIDLNGNTISGVDKSTVSYGLINNKGTLTITDTIGTGKITLSATTNRFWNYYSSTISNQQGTVIINSGTIEHTGGTDMAYAIDNLTNGNGGNASLTIDGGVLKSTYRAIRQFANSTTCENILTINNGEIISTTDNKGAVWLTNANAYTNKASLNINGGSISAVYIYNPTNGDPSQFKININEECITSKVTYGNINAKINNIYYETLDKALESISDTEENTVIDLLSNTITINGEYTIPTNIKVTNGNLIISDITTLNGNDSVITFENVNICNKSTVTFGNINIKLLNGHFTFNPTKYLEDTKVAISSNEDGYIYTIDEKNQNIDIKTDLNVQEPTIENTENILIEGDFKADESVLESEAILLINNESIIGNKEQALKQLIKELGDEEVSGKTPVVLVHPYIDITVDSYELESNEYTVQITPKYNVLATIASDNEDIILDNENGKVNAVILKEAQTTSYKIDKPITITIALPIDFATPNSTIYVYHKSYVYEAQVDSEGKTATFTNPHGFSTFTVKKENGGAKNNNTNITYSTLENAILEVNNNETISLLTNNNEIIEVKKDLTFNLDKSTFEFTGEIKAGKYTTVETTVTDNIINYVFDYSKPSSSGGGSIVSTLTVKFDTNGGSTIKNINVKKNGIIEKPTDPTKEGYTFIGWYTDKNCTESYNFNTKITKGFTLYAKWIENKETIDVKDLFDDVDTSDWFYDAVQYAVENGLCNGISDTEFAPSMEINRAMFVTILYRYEKEPLINSESKFNDVVANSYYEKAVIWAEEMGLVNGMSDTEFAPQNIITREQIVTIMYRFAKYKGLITNIEENTNILSYEDYDNISEYAIPAMQWACGNEIINGKTPSTLEPKDTATRAEVVTMLMRFTK